MGKKIVLFILISAGVAILGSLLPWASLNAGSFGSYSVNGYQGDGWFVIIAAIVSIVLACLNNMNKAYLKGSQLVSLLRVQLQLSSH